MEAPPVRIARHESEHGQWDSFTRPPDRRFGDYVRSYEGYVEGAAGFARRVQVPTDDIPLIINFGAPIRVQRPQLDPVPQTFGHFIAGVHDAHVLVDSLGPSDLVQINLSPIGGHLFLGVPMDELANRTVELSDVLGGDADDFAARLYEEATWEGRFELIDAFLHHRLDAAGPPARAIEWAWGQLQASAGGARIGSLAGRLGWSRKHLVAQFREHLGQPPKTLARILRFQHLVGRLAQIQTPNWGELALESGYYDQAHFNREFHEFTGLTPGEFLTRMVPDGGVVGD